MVQHSQTKRGRDIKSKLMAAIAMLLIASIMMVSTTYAWFTLSTAPEVTGITTSVGANGNLEMALLPTYGGTDGKTMYEDVASSVAGIGTATGDMNEVQKNTTWGNLVNLSDTSYGLNNIVLYPSALNLPETNGVLADTLTAGAILNIPTYGSDGRVSGFKQVGMTGVYDGGAFFEGGYGVRAVGASSGMSAIELAFRSAVAAGNSAASRASNAASSSLSTGGTTLATMAMQRAMDDSATYDEKDIQAILDVYTALESGALTYIETALRQYAVACYLVTVDTSTTSNYEETVNTILNPDTSLSSLATYLPTELGDVISGFVSIQNDVDNSITALTALVNEHKASYSWDEFSAHVHKLVDTNNMKLNGETMSYWTETKDGKFTHISELVAAATSSTGLNLVVSDGMYYDIAVYSGNITAAVRLENLEYNGLVASVNATMKTDYNGVVYLTSIKSAVSGMSVKDGSSEQLPISDYYGYAIDLAFRTNASDSYLQLQTEGIDRVYSDNESNVATMGGGATMSFSVNGIDGYTSANVVNLMECFRVVFYDPATMTIFGFARLNPETVVVDEAGNYTMGLYMYDEQNDTWSQSNKITALTQNEAKAVSVFVYLDGEEVTNADVATENILGKMNLQFSSSAELTPMEYADLRNSSAYSVTLPAAGITGATTASANTDYVFTVTNGGTPIVKVDDATVTPTNNGDGVYTIPAASVIGNIVITFAAEATSYDVTVPTGVTGEQKATAGADYTFTVSAGYTLGTVTVGETTIEPTDNGNGSYTIPAASVTGDIVINATANS